MSDEVEAPQATAKWSSRLAAYVAAQGGAIEAMRDHAMPSEPWPDHENPMLAYLIEAALEPLGGEATDAVQSVVVWLAVHAWYEGVLDQAARSVRSITD